jgi:uncharacterized protein YceK
MRIKNYVILMVCAVVLSGCGSQKSWHAPSVIEIIPIDINTGITMETDGDVSWRRYTFKDIPLGFVFTDSVVSRLSYGRDYHVRLHDIFYKPGQAEENVGTISLNHTWNLEYFMADQVRSVITAAYRVNVNGRQYVVCSFTKNRLSTLPYEDNIHYLIDITNKNSINAIAFPDVNDDGGTNDVADDLFFGNNGLCIRFKYYSKLHPNEVSNGIIAQNEKWEWVIE